VALYCEGIHDDGNGFAVLQFAQNPQRSVEDVARAYAEEWLKLSGRDAALAGEAIAGLGTEVSNDWPKGMNAGADNPHADDRLYIFLEVRPRTPRLEDNFRYWLLHYRPVTPNENHPQFRRSRSAGSEAGAAVIFRTYRSNGKKNRRGSVLCYFG